MLRIYSFLPKFKMGLSGDTFALNQVYNSHSLILNNLTIEQTKRLRACPGASSLFVQELNEDSVGGVISVNQLVGDGKESAMHLSYAQLPAVIEKYDRIAEAYLKAGSASAPIEDLIFNFLRLSAKLSHDALIFSFFQNQEYE